MSEISSLSESPTVSLFNLSHTLGRCYYLRHHCKPWYVSKAEGGGAGEVLGMNLKDSWIRGCIFQAILASLLRWYSHTKRTSIHEGSRTNLLDRSDWSGFYSAFFSSWQLQLNLLRDNRYSSWKQGKAKYSSHYQGQSDRHPQCHGGLCLLKKHLRNICSYNMMFVSQDQTVIPYNPE